MEDAPPYVVVCISSDADAGEGHDHVEAVETRDPDGGITRWRAADVIAAIRDGQRFVVEDGERTSAVSLEPAVCPACARVTILVDPSVPRPAAC